MAPRWLTREIVTAIHGELVREFGGSTGIRDDGLLNSAVSRPVNLLAYGDRPSLPDLAVAYCYGIVSNHPFVDGNKRAGYVAAHVFLELNGHRFDPPETEVVNVIMALAAGELDETSLAAWFSAHARPGG